MTAVVIIEGLVILMLLVLVAGLLKSHAEILRKLDRLGAGDAAEPMSQAERLRTTGLGKAPLGAVSGVDPGGAATSASLEHGKGETLLAFLSTGCASCRVFWSELGIDTQMPTPTTRPVIVTKGNASESPAKVAELAPNQVRVIMSDEAWDAFKVPLTPYFMLVDGEGGVIGEGSATDMNHLNSLLKQSSADASPIRLGSKDRSELTDHQLSRSGVDPGDPSLYEDPLT